MSRTLAWLRNLVSPQSTTGTEYASPASLKCKIHINAEELRCGCTKTIEFERSIYHSDSSPQTETARVAVNIPAGIQDGARIHIPGEGDTHLPTETAGDLYAYIFYEEGME